MNVLIFFFLIFCAIIIVCGQLTSTFVQFVANGTCGQPTAGPIVQRVTTRLKGTGGFFWSDFGVKLCYIDRYGTAMGRYTPEDGRYNRMQINRGLESISISPVKDNRRNFNNPNNYVGGLLFVVGVDNKLILSNVTGVGNKLSTTETELMTVSDKPESFIRGRCDDKGRFWYVSTGVGKGNYGRLYKIEYLGTPVVMIDDLVYGTGMAWTPDYKTFYLVDNGLGTIYQYDFNSKYGTISNKQIIFRLKDIPNILGTPFDIVVDTDGNLWISMFQGGSVVQYNIESQIVMRSIAVPARDVVSLAFGQLDHKTLYVGTVRNDSDTESGSIFAILGLGVTGIPDNEIVIPPEYTN